MTANFVNIKFISILFCQRKDGYLQKNLEYLCLLSTIRLLKWMTVFSSEDWPPRVLIHEFHWVVLALRGPPHLCTVWFFMVIFFIRYWRYSYIIRKLTCRISHLHWKNGGNCVANLKKLAELYNTGIEIWFRACH